MNEMGCGIGLTLSNKISKLIQPHNFSEDGI